MNKKKLIVLFSILLVVFSTLTIFLKNQDINETLKKQIQIVFNDNKIPLEILDLKLNGSIKEILSGYIPKAEINFKIKDTKTNFKITTVIDYKLNTSRLQFKMNPKIESETLPEIGLNIDLDLNFTRNNTKIIIGNIDAQIEIESTKPYNYTLNNNIISTQNITTKTNVHLDLTKTPLLITSDSNVKLNSIHDNNTKITIPKLEFNLSSQILLDEKPLFIIQSLNVLSPLKLKIFGAIDEKSLKLNFFHQSSLNELLKSLNTVVNIPLLKTISSKGLVTFDGKLTGSLSNPSFNGYLTLNSEFIKISHIIGDNSVSFNQVNLKLPLLYPNQNFDGSLNIKNLTLNALNVENINFLIIKIENEIHFVLNKNQNENKSLSIPIFGSVIRLNNLKIRLPLTPDETGHSELKIPGISFPLLISLSVDGGPFEITEIQKSFCILNSTQLNGKISFEFPRVFNSQNGFHFLGNVTANVLGGKIELDSLRYFWNDINPKILLSTNWNDLDLHEIGEISHFGDMRGSLNGSLLNSEYALTPLGPIPLSYDLTIKGAKRSGKDIRFYGRAVDNILELLGSRKSDMPWFAQWGINLSMKFRNWFPATADYMGFRAKTSGGWTELYTFDPENEKNHYFLSGTAFKIPLNTHGIYPAIMRTDAFQGWLWGMLDYFKKLSNEKENKNISANLIKTETSNDPSKCVPFWEFKK